MNYKDEEIIASYEMQLKRNVAAGIIDNQECERILKKLKISLMSTLI